MRRLFRGALAVLIIAGAMLAIPSSVSAQQASNPDAGLVVSKKRLFINEGSSKTFTVKLATQPRIIDLETDIRIYSTVSVGMKPDDSGIATIATATQSPGDDGWLRLTFTRDNWNVAQTVTVSAVTDDDRVDEMTGIEFSTGSADSDYYDLDHDLTAVVLETQRDEVSPERVNVSVRSAHGQRYVLVTWSGNPSWGVFRRNLTRGDTEFDYLGVGQLQTPARRDYGSGTGIVVYRVGREAMTYPVLPREMSHSVGLYFRPPGGA